MKLRSLTSVTATLIALCLFSSSLRANPSLAISVRGKITKPDGSLAPDGLTVEAQISKKGIHDTGTTKLRDDGDNYVLTLMGSLLNEAKWPEPGDKIELVVRDENNRTLGRKSHTITKEEDEAGVVTLDFQLSGIHVDITPARIPGDGRSEATVNIKVVDQEGNPVLGDTLTVESSLDASLPAPTAVEGEPGSYQTTYTAPVETGTDRLTITSTKLGQSVTSEIELTFAPALLTVELLDEEGNPLTTLAADGKSTAEVLVTVKKVETGLPVSDEELTVTADLGEVSSVTNNEDGTYAAVYTAGTVWGDETLTVETKESGSKIKTLTLEAGPAAEINVSVAPSVIAADGVSTATVTATVTDENGNPINDASVRFEVVGEGTVEPTGTFKENGKYTSTYTSPVLEAPETATLKASSGEVSGAADVKLILQPLKSSSFMTVFGAIYLEDGKTRAPYGLDVTVKNLAKEVQISLKSDKLNGYDYEAVFAGPLLDMDTVAETHDAIQIEIAKNGEPVEILSPESPYKLKAEDVSAGEARIDITTNLEAKTSTLAVRGAILYKDGEAHAPHGLEVTVKNLSKDLQLSVLSSKLNGYDYEAVFFGAIMDVDPVASGGDEIEITLKKADGTPLEILEPAMPYTLKPAEVAEGQLKIDLTADISAEAATLTVSGSVYKADGTPIPAGYEVEVTNPSVGVSWSDKSTEGGYSLTLFSGGKTVISSGHTLEIRIFDEAGALRAVKSFKPMASEILTGHAEAPDIKFAVYKFTPPSTVEFPRKLELDEIDGTFSGDFTIALEYEGTGEPVTDEEPIAEVTYGEVSDFTNNDDGTYTATYTVDGKTLPFSGDDEVDVRFTIKFQRGTPEEFTRTIKDDTRPTPVIDAVVQYRDGRTKKVSSEFDGRKYTGYVAVNAGDTVSLDASRSFENVGVAEYEWKLPWIEEYRSEMRRASSATPEADVEQTALPVITREFLFPEPGVYTVELDVIDVAGNRSSFRNKATFTILVDQLELGGISVDLRHYLSLMDDRVYQLTKDLLEKYRLPVRNFFHLLRSSPTYRPMIADMSRIFDLFFPPGLLPALPLGSVRLLDVVPEPNVALGNFSNAIVPASKAEFPYSPHPSSRRHLTLAGDHLSLYLQVPHRDAAEVIFNLSGNSTPARRFVGDKISHRFVLEEEQALLLLPSWPGKDETELSPSLFSSVYLYYAAAPVGSGPLPDIPPTAPDGSAISGADFSQYISVPMQMTRDSNDKVIWTADVGLDAGNHYFYFFSVEIEEPIKMTVPVPGQKEPFETEIDKWTMPDPRNLQIEDRGTVEYVVTPELKEEAEKLLEPLIKAVSENAPPPPLEVTPEQMTAIQNIVMESGKMLSDYTLASKDPLLVSRLKLPAPRQVEDAQFSLWTGDLDLSSLPDGDYQLKASVVDADGNLLDELPSKQIAVDRNSVSTALSVAEKENAATYIYEDETGRGVVVATLGAQEPALLKLEAEGVLPDYYGIAFQILEHSKTESQTEIWKRVIALSEYGVLLDPGVPAGISLSKDYAYNNIIFNDVPMAKVPKDASSVAVEMKLSPYYSSERTRHYLLRSVAVDTAMNIGKSPPIRLEVVPGETDKATVSSDKETISPDTEKVTLTVKFSERTVHPVGIEVQQRVGEADWTKIGKTISLARGRGDGDWSRQVEWRPDFDALSEAAGDLKEVKLRAVAKNALDVVDKSPEEIHLRLSTSEIYSSDLNKDGKIDIFDLVTVGRDFGKKGKNLKSDVNEDGKVDIFDLVLVARHLGETVSAAPPLTSKESADHKLDIESLSDQKLLLRLYEILKSQPELTYRMRLALSELKKMFSPVETKLLPNYPNPFNPETWIPFHLKDTANVIISIHDIEGQLVRKIGVGKMPAGIYTSKDKAVYWDGRNDAGESVSSGLYFYTLQAGDYRASKKMLILK